MDESNSEEARWQLSRYAPPATTSEWTAENMAGKWSRGEDWIIKEHNAALAAERQKREIAERSAKAWEEDAKRYATNAEDANLLAERRAQEILQYQEQLAAERAAKELAISAGQAMERRADQLREQITAERKKVK